MYYIYIIKCTGGELYTGISADISRRMKEHFSQSEKCAKYTRSHKADSLEALWTAPNRSLASKLEFRIKALRRSKKLEIIKTPEKFSELFDEPVPIEPVKDFSLDKMINKQ